MSRKAVANNVVLFPPDRVKNPLRTAIHSDKLPRSLDEIKNAFDLIKTKRASEVIETIMPLIIQGFAVYGINFSEEDPRYFAMIAESIRSLIYKHFKMSHPMQALTESIFELRDGKLEVAKISVKEKPDVETHD